MITDQQKSLASDGWYAGNWCISSLEGLENLDDERARQVVVDISDCEITRIPTSPQDQNVSSDDVGTIDLVLDADDQGLPGIHVNLPPYIENLGSFVKRLALTAYLFPTGAIFCVYMRMRRPVDKRSIEGFGFEGFYPLDETATVQFLEKLVEHGKFSLTFLKPTGTEDSIQVDRFSVQEGILKSAESSESMLDIVSKLLSYHRKNGARNCDESMSQLSLHLSSEYDAIVPRLGTNLKPSLVKSLFFSIVAFFAGLFFYNVAIMFLGKLSDVFLGLFGVDSTSLNETFELVLIVVVVSVGIILASIIPVFIIKDHRAQKRFLKADRFYSLERLARNVGSRHQ